MTYRSLFFAALGADVGIPDNFVRIGMHRFSVI